MMMKVCKPNIAAANNGQLCRSYGWASLPAWKLFRGISLIQPDLPNICQSVYADRWRSQHQETATQYSSRDSGSFLETSEHPGVSTAITLAEPDVHLQRVDEIPKHQDLINASGVLTYLQPFIAPIDVTNVGKRQIRLGHHSLRELLWKESPTEWDNLGELIRLSDRHVRQRQARLEAGLLRICVRSLLLEEVNDLEVFPEHFKKALELQNFPEDEVFGDFAPSLQEQYSPQDHAPNDAISKVELLVYDPVESGLGGFFAYASCFWCNHLRGASEEFLPDVSDLMRLCWAGSKRLQNWTQQQLYPECALRPNFGDGENEELDPLIILSLHGPPSALQLLLQNCDVSADGFLPDSFSRAFDRLGRTGELHVMDMIYQYRSSTVNFPAFDFLYALMYRWQQLEGDTGRTDECFDVIHDMFQFFVDEHWGTTLICAAVRFDCLPVINILMNEAKQNSGLKNEMLKQPSNDDTHEHHKSFVMQAVLYGSDETLAFLLGHDQGPGRDLIQRDLRRLDEKGNTVFHVAARENNTRKMGLLIHHWKEGADQINATHDTPLNIAVFGKHLDIARQLLEIGDANVRGRFVGEERVGDEDECWHQPLRTAVRSGNLAMCSLLVEVGGADPRTALKPSDDGQLSLLDSPNPNHPVLHLLRSYIDQA